MNEPAIRDPEVLEGVVADPPKPTPAESFAAGFAAMSKQVGAAMKVLGEQMRAALVPFQKMFHLVGHGQPAKCRTCNPRGNPPPAPWAADYRRKTRNRNARRK